MKNIAVLADFDGTATKINVLDSLYMKFGGPSHSIHMERWRRGEISTIEELELIFETITASRQEMEDFLRTVELDPGFIPLLETCREREYAFAIVSDGLRWYIDYILESNHLEEIRVYAGELIFTEQGFNFEYPWFDLEYPMRSTAKPLIVNEYQSRGYNVVFVGDGLSDVEAIVAANFVYAKDVLLTEAERIGVEVQEFGDLNDVVRDLRGRFKSG